MGVSTYALKMGGWNKVLVHIGCALYQYYASFQILRQNFQKSEFILLLQLLGRVLPLSLNWDIPVGMI